MRSVQDLVLALALVLLCTALRLPAQAPADVPPQYRRLFYQYSDQRSLYEKALNSVGVTAQPKGRSFALVAAVTQYPNMPQVDRELKPAAVDLEKLKSYLKTQEYFDEIVVLKDGDFNLETLSYFLLNYFPDRLGKSPHARFLFAFSGHGYAVGSGETARGSLLTSAAASKTDAVNRIDLSVLRTLIDPDVDTAEKVLVLINACQSGAFLGRKSFGANPLGPGERGAYAIMASRSNQQSLQLSNVGQGSVFFEKIFAALDGAADTGPRDGVVTYHELDAYLNREIPLVTNGAQIPMEGDISRNGSVGEFYFLNRSRQVQLGNAKAWNGGTSTSFGFTSDRWKQDGDESYRAGKYKNALLSYYFAAMSGDAAAMEMLGVLYGAGMGGITKNMNLAREWYEKAAAAGNADAMVNLGVLYMNGTGVEQEYRRAMLEFQQGADAGNSYGMMDLGILYANGYGVEKNLKTAASWYEKAAGQGNADAMVAAANLYRGDTPGIAANPRRSRELYEHAMAAGSTEAIFRIGEMYELGYGTAVDYAEAKRWYERAAAKGDGGGMTDLGDLYRDGHGVPKDFALAREWYTKAKAAGFAEAEQRLKELPQ